MEAAKAGPTKGNLQAARGDYNGWTKRRKLSLTPGVSVGLLPAMKKVLSLLLAFVFLQVQTFALSGGPQYQGSSASVSGTYAGVLIPAAASNSLGLFVLGVPSQGLASGSFAIFQEGRAFYGSVVGVIDPDKLTLAALAQAQQNRTSTVVLADGTVRVFLTPEALASGSIRAELKPTQTAVGSNSGYRIEGTGTLATSSLTDVFFEGSTGAVLSTIDVIVDGFQQSTAVTGTVNIASLTGTQTTQ